MASMLDRSDRAILKILQQDASISNLELSKKIGLSPSACLMRTKSLRESGIIQQFTTIMDEKQLGLETQAFVLVNLSPLNRQNLQRFVEEVGGLPQVQECYTLAGSHDLLLKIVTQNMQAYRDFMIDALMSNPCIHRVETNMILSVEKRTTALPIEAEE